MSKLLPGAKGCKERAIVVLTRENIVWYQVSIAGDLHHVSTQNYCSGNVDIPERFSSVEGTCQVIELLVDTHVDDLDRAKVVDGGPQCFQSFRTARALWSLKREYAESQILPLPKKYFPNIASILHTSLPENYQLVVENLQANGLVISHMTSSTQLLCGAIKNKGLCLFVVPCGALQQRFMLIDSGVIVFMRIVNPESGGSENSEKNVETYIEESLDYLMQANLLESRDVHIATADTLGNESCSKMSLESYLANTYVRGVAALDTHARNSSSLLNEEGAADRVDVDRKEAPSRVRRLIRQLVSSLGIWSKAKNVGSFFQPHQVTDSRLKHHDVLKPSRSIMRSHIGLVLLRRATIALAIVTFLSVLVASIHSIRQIRGLNSLKDERENIEAEIKQLRSVLQDQHPDPFYVAATLKGNQEFSENLKGSPQSVLTLVATLIQDFPAIQLQSLFWSMMPSDSDKEMVLSSVVHTAARTSFVEEKTTREILSITFEGSFESAASLRDRQQQLEDFSQSLSQSELISNISILDSPVASAGSSESFGDGDGYFRIRFWVALL